MRARRAIGMTEQVTRLDKALELVKEKKTSEYRRAPVGPILSYPGWGREDAHDPANVTGPCVPLLAMKAQVDGTVSSSQRFLHATPEEELVVAALVQGQYTPVTVKSHFGYHTETPLSKLLQNTMLYGYHVAQARTIKDLAPDKYYELVREGAALEASKGVQRMVKPLPVENKGDRLVPADAWQQVQGEVSYESLSKDEASALLCGFKRSAYEVPTTGDEGKFGEKRIKENLRLVEIGRASAINELQQQSVANALVL